MNFNEGCGWALRVQVRRSQEHDCSRLVATAPGARVRPSSGPRTGVPPASAAARSCCPLQNLIPRHYFFARDKGSMRLNYASDTLWLWRDAADHIWACIYAVGTRHLSPRSMGRRKSGRLGASADAAGTARASCVARGDKEWRGLWVARMVEEDSDDSEDWDEADTVPIRGLSTRRRAPLRTGANWEWSTKGIWCGAHQRDADRRS
jgi:hypothetical protein